MQQAVHCIGGIKVAQGQFQVQNVHDVSVQASTPTHGYHLRRQIGGDHHKSAGGKVLTVVTRAGTYLE
jgi:hypothetical protein